MVDVRALIRALALCASLARCVALRAPTIGLDRSAVASLQLLSQPLQTQLAQRCRLDDLGATARGVGCWRECFLRGRVPDAALDADGAWPATGRERCVLLFSPVARLVGRHPKLADAAASAFLDCALRGGEDDGDDEGEDAGAPLAAAAAAIEALEAVYGLDGAGPVLDALLDEEGDLWLGSAASSGGAGRFEARAPAFATMRALAERLAAIPALGDLLAGLGRRSTASEGARRVGAASRSSRSGAPGAVASFRPPATDGHDGEVAGRDLSALVAAEKLLLADGDGEGSAARLFRARYGAAALRSAAPVSVDGDTVRVARRTARLPRRPRGPIVIAVDTSFSMTGGREALAKAVALAACRAAAAQKRAAVVLAFGAADELAELRCPVDGATAANLGKLLDFLTRSFGGGTDVISPLRRAVALVEGDPAYADADVLLVTDGELMDPPIDAETLAKIDRLRRTRSLQIAGLLAGRSRLDDGAAGEFRNAAPGSPLDALCDSVHTFLAEHDDLALLRGAAAAAAAAPPRETARPAFARGRPLYAAPAGADAEAPSAEAPSAEAPADRPALDFPVSARELEAAAAFLSRGLVERETEARLVLLGAVAREHVLFVGPPGVAKSLLCRRLGALLGGSYFEVALTRFASVDDVFGPLSLEALKGDEYRRASAGFAPHASTIFFDEIFRARSLLPALLALLNEREWQDGPARRGAALVSAVAASNELRADDDDDGDDALFDRFLLRRAVAPVSDRGAVLLLADADADADADGGGGAPPPPPLLAALADAGATLPRAALGRAHAATLADARAWLRDERCEYVSDRRLAKCGRLVRTAAAANGRAAVGALDVLLAAHALWQRPATLEPLTAWLLDRAVPDDAPTLALLLEALGDRPDATAAAADVRAAAEAARDDLAAAAAATAAAGQVFLSPDALVGARQRLADLAARRSAALAAVADAARAVEAGLPLPALELEAAAPRPAASVDGDAGDAGDLDLTLSKKQAKARYSPGDFRRWTALRADARRK